ncbi:MAG: hypothetical protein D6737_15360 [Chloroflexi bacterium]|nr:MAG: hypothetical protein D6737_15360 [Chloroflexota bacterium]
MLRIYALILLGVVMLTGCSLSTETTGSQTDATAAQQFLPNLAGYTQTEATNVTDALAAVGSGGALISGNAALALLINRLDAMANCYNEIGAVAARVYTQVNLEDIIENEIPEIGVVAVINRNRVADNLLACAVQSSGAAAFSAQSAEPCSASGSFEVNGETIDYIYGATQTSLCDKFAQSFAGR